MASGCAMSLPMVVIPRFSMIPPPCGGGIMLKRMVRTEGFELTLLAERDFESRASTNSTTPASRHAYSETIKMRNVKSELFSLFR